MATNPDSDCGRRTRVTLQAPSRLAFTLINLGLDSDRINGGAGVALSEPSFRCQVESSSALRIEGPKASSFAYVQEAMEYLGQLLDYLHCPPVHLRVIREIPAHTGFGSKTATLLAMGRAVAALHKIQVDTATLARIGHRAGTSGVGVNTFDRGGFVIDGGHPIPPNTPDLGTLFRPSRFSRMDSVPPLLFHHGFPWPLLIIVPVGHTIQGEIELAHFQKTCPIPTQSVHEIAHVVCFRMAAALVEGNYAAFCRAVNDLQKTAWKASQIEAQTDQVRHLLDQGRQYGLDAIGISSNGPALYGLTTDLPQVTRWLSHLVDQAIVKSWWVSNVPKHGVVIRRSAYRGKA